jgi:benzoate membrane transport protein
MFAGNVLGHVTNIFSSLETQPWVVGAAIGGYLGARALGRLWFPPMAGAVLIGMVVAGVSGQIEPSSFRWSAPVVAPIRPEFEINTLFALSIPLVIVAIGIGNVQGLGMLVAQGYRPPVRLLTVWMGVTSLVNAAFGGHVSAIQNSGVGILGGPDAGPRESRYVANLVAATIAVFLGLCAATAGSLLGLLPPGFVPALAGLALISAMLDALQKAVRTELPMGAFFALIIASSSLTILGIGAAFWALVGGLLISLLLERPALQKTWHPEAA